MAKNYPFTFYQRELKTKINKWERIFNSYVENMPFFVILRFSRSTHFDLPKINTLCLFPTLYDLARRFLMIIYAIRKERIFQIIIYRNCEYILHAP